MREKLGEAKDDALEKLKLYVKNAKLKAKGAKGETLNYDGGDCWI